ncbi:cation diffusion facilitator family transporter [Paenibacillus darwinianus]|uniref:cation diffusion facilitator family transporter n=4 Tax=Paenibacillus darwinianus TaxID=1380763 RepID=UPI000453A96C|nr:cation transporter dimerization domain-containing protein [Paenibacillus darwinianus]EXX88802.1 cation diffusion facilitator family transporter [Paenibacillus darwinianus]
MAKRRLVQRNTEAEAGLWGNAGLALLKGVAGWLTGSTALLADAFRSGAEAAQCGAAAIGVRGAKRLPRREAEPGGDDGAVQASNLVVALLTLVVGIEIGISAVRHTAEGLPAAPQWPALAVIAAAWAIKAAFFSVGGGRLETYALAVVLAGTAGAWLGGRLGQPSLLYLDSAAAFFVAVLVTLQGYRLIAAAMPGGKPAGLPRTDEAELRETVQGVEGVIAVPTIRAREQGHYVAVAAAISVNPRITVLEGQEIAKRVKDQVFKRFTHVTDVQVQVDPYDPGYPYKSNHDPNQEHMPTLLQ